MVELLKQMHLQKDVAVERADRAGGVRTRSRMVVRRWWRVRCIMGAKGYVVPEDW